MDRLSKALPTYFLRYEDLLTKNKELLTELFCFLLNVKSIEGTVIEKRISDLMEKESKKTSTLYQLKKGQDYKKLIRNEWYYTPE